MSNLESKKDGACRTDMRTHNSRSLVLVSWNGTDTPLDCILKDTTPNFDFILFDYSGENTHLSSLKVNENQINLLSKKTECKGDLFRELGNYLIENRLSPEYVGLIDDDIIISIQDINRALHLARINRLDVFSPALSHDSQFSHKWMLQQSLAAVRHVPWVEVMMPFYKSEIFFKAQPFFKEFISSWGFDKYLFPMVQKITNLNNCGLINTVAATHYRPITSQTKVYRNGLTAVQEMNLVKKTCTDYIKEKHPELLNTNWYHTTYIKKNPVSKLKRHLYSLGRPIRKWLEKCI